MYESICNGAGNCIKLSAFFRFFPNLPLSNPDLPDGEVETNRPTWYPGAMAALLARAELDPGAVTAAFRDLLTGRVEDAHAASFLAALRMKAETGAEIAAAASVLRERMIRLVPVSAPVLDTCGTGGDDSGTFNISTATALVVAACGVPVVKHGNRAVSSRSGSADVLRELGVPIESGPDWAQRCLERIGFAFCFAPQFHDGMKNVAKLRRALGIRTIFNLLGPLANPANAEFQLLGVGKPELLDPLADAAARLGIRRAVLVCSQDGLDEVSLSAPTTVRLVEGDSFSTMTWTAADFGLAPAALADLTADGPAASALRVREVLAGQDGPALRIVLANAAAALWTAGAVTALRDGVAKAEAAIRSGLAHSVLEQLVAMR
jgi:anthranilate phosphoribosyltransferase